MHPLCTPGSCCRNTISIASHGLPAHVLLETFRIVKSRRRPTLAGWLAGTSAAHDVEHRGSQAWPPLRQRRRRRRGSARSLPPGQSAGHQTRTRTCPSRMNDAVAPLLISLSPSAEGIFSAPGSCCYRMAPLLQHITQLPATPKSPGRALTSKTHDPWRTVQACISTLVFFTDYVVRTPPYLHTL